MAEEGRWEGEGRGEIGAPIGKSDAEDSSSTDAFGEKPQGGEQGGLAHWGRSKRRMRERGAGGRRRGQSGTSASRTRPQARRSASQARTTQRSAEHSDSRRQKPRSMAATTTATAPAAIPALRPASRTANHHGIRAVGLVDSTRAAGSGFGLEGFRVPAWFLMESSATKGLLPCESGR